MGKQWTLAWLMAWMVTAAALAEPVAADKWLIDLGRDYPLSPQAGLSSADAEITLLLMQAATRINPDRAEGYRWQVDLLEALGRGREALEALDAYRTRRPGDISAYVAWVRGTLGTRQTAEQRKDFCLEYLKRDDLPGPVIAYLRVHLARYHWNRAEPNEALKQALTAVKAQPENLEARAVLADLLPAGDPVIDQVDDLLIRLAAQPGNIELAIGLGDILVTLGMPAAADRWYAHALALEEALEAVPPDPDLWIARSEVLLELGRLEQAEQFASRATRFDPKLVRGHILRALVAQREDNEVRYNAYMGQAVDMAEEILKQEAGSVDPDVLAEVAWFFAYYAPRPKEAERIARDALDRRPPSLVARRALGSSLRQRSLFAEARRTLEPAAEDDLWAAIELAQTLHAMGDAEAAEARLRKVTAVPSTGEQRTRIAELMGEWNLDLPTTQPAASAIRTLVDTFPTEVLDYPLHPGRYLGFSVRPPAPALSPAEPWPCEFVVENKGSFAITVGPGRMIDPEILCWVNTAGDRLRSSGPVIRVSLGRYTSLEPGRRYAFTQTMKLGAIRSAMIGTPQVSHEVEIGAVLNPWLRLDAKGNETVVPALGGLAAPVCRFRRTPLRFEQWPVARLIDQSRTGQLDERILATERLGMLLAEHQHLQAGRLHHAARPIDAAEVQASVLARANDPDWPVRVRLCECMRWFVLDRQAKQVAANLLNDAHWLVRGLALRMLADHQGKAFDSVLTTTAIRDPDPWVRAMAKALSDRIRGRRPATAPHGSPDRRSSD